MILRSPRYVSRHVPRHARIAAAIFAGAVAAPLTASAQADSSRLSAVLGTSATHVRPAITGIVRDRSGRPQIGAAVELLDSAYQVMAQTFTDDRGHYALPNVGTGTFQIKASDVLFLPTLHPNVRLLANSRLVINLTLATFEQAVQWLPAQSRTPETPVDDWDWTLRLSTNRPLLRMLDPDVAQAAALAGSPDLAGPVIVDTGTERGADLSRIRHQLAVRSGVKSFGEGDTTQDGTWIASQHAGRGLMIHATTGLDPETAALSRMGTTIVYRQELSPDRSMITVASITTRPQIEGGGQDSETSGLTTARVRSVSSMRMGDLAELQAGTELVADRMGSAGTVTGNHPFGVIAVHPGDSTTVRYAISTAPGMSDTRQMDSMDAASAPGISEVDGRLLMQEGLHQEISIVRTSGALTGSVAVFHDHLGNPVVEGAPTAQNTNSFTGDVLYDPTSGMIAVSGHGYSGGGVLAMLHDQLSPDTWVTLEAAMGEAQTISAESQASDLPSFASSRSPMLSVTAGTAVPATGTRLRAGYRWQPDSTLTAVAPYAIDIPEAYLSFSIRQPLRLDHAGTRHLDAIVDVRNLLAQGYRPFLTADGSTVIFAQERRCIAAGLSFSW